MDIFVPILKADAARREVYGVIAEEVKDKSGEIFDYETSKPYVKAWSDEALNRTVNAGQEISLGNVRSQHSKVAAGKLVSITFDDAAKRIPVIAKIVDDSEWKKVEEGIYTGFSIGGSYVKRWSDGAAIRYTAKPTEVSIVDNPCMAGATFTLVKADGAFEYRGFAGAPSNQSSELDRLSAQIRGQVNELMAKLNALAANRAAAAHSANFVTKLAESKVEWNDTAKQELEKALANGTRIDVAQPEVSASPRFKVNGVEKADVAAQELEKALARPIRIG